MKSIPFLEKVYIFYIHGQEYRNRDYNLSSKTVFMIYKIINCELVKYESWASLLLESDLLVHPIPPWFLWFLKQTHCSSVGGRLPLALNSSPQQVIVLPTLYSG